MLVISGWMFANLILLGFFELVNSTHAQGRSPTDLLQIQTMQEKESVIN